MNANELADLIEKGGKDGFFQDEIVAMLRQQQAEIEALKLQNNNYWVMIEILRQKVKAQEK